MAKWTLKKPAVNIELMAKTLKISKTTATVLANRNVRTKNDAIKYLSPNLKFQYDPFIMSGMTEAVKLIASAISNFEKIAIYGDYDVDGITSTTILYKTLKSHGADVIYYIPDREEEGYGLNKISIKHLKDRGVEMLLTCDNGIAALEEVLYGKEIGLKIVIIDHHEPSFLSDSEGNKVDVPPKADAIIDPKLRLCNYPYKMLCAGGLAYKFALAFHLYCEKEFLLHDELLIFASIATFCDIVDLQDENRIIAKNGLELLNIDPINLGLKTLIAEKGIENKKLTTYDVGFILGPCINAAGRLDVATIAVELFTTENPETAIQLAKKLSDLNEERKTMTNTAVENVLQKIDEYKNDPVLVIYDKDVHESIAGIVAGKIKDTVYKPTILLTKGEGFAKGSARSIEGYNIFEELFLCRELFERFGGHSMAAGLSLKEENIPALREMLSANCKLTEEDYIEEIKIDRELDLSEVTYELAKELEILQPFGKENHEPLFGTKKVRVMQIDLLGENKKTVRFTFEIENSKRRLKGICFNKLDKLKSVLTEKYSEEAAENILKDGKDLFLILDIIYVIDINEYNNNVSVQLKIKDFR